VAALVLIASAMTVLYVASRLILQWSGGRFGFSEVRDPASLPLLMLILALYGPVASAGFHAFGRGIEQGADRFALALTQDRLAMASQMQRYLSCSSLKDPDVSWIRRTFRQSHPSLRERIALAEAHPIGRGE
jgi:Zn-dependent protease with chaperone function